jgi:hypothetical protein
MHTHFRTGCILHVLFPRDAADKCTEARTHYVEECRERVRACRSYSGVAGLYTNSGYTGDDGTRFHCLAADAADAAEQAAPSVVAPSQAPPSKGRREDKIKKEKKKAASTLSKAPPSPLSLSLLFPRTCEQLASGLFRWIRYLYIERARAFKYSM